VDWGILFLKWRGLGGKYLEGRASYKAFGIFQKYGNYITSSITSKDINHHRIWKRIMI
jgi:hypothetical protein